MFGYSKKCSIGTQELGDNTNLEGWLLVRHTLRLRCVPSGGALSMFSNGFLSQTPDFRRRDPAKMLQVRTSGEMCQYEVDRWPVVELNQYEMIYQG